MFEDQTPIQPQQSPSQSALPPLRPAQPIGYGTQGGGIQPPAPSNLPIGGAVQAVNSAEDIFSGTADIPVGSTPIQAAEVSQRNVEPSAHTSQAPQGKSESEVLTLVRDAENSTLQATLPESLPQVKGGDVSKRKVLVFFLTAIILALLGVAGYLIYRIIEARGGLFVSEPIDANKTGQGVESQGQSPEAKTPSEMEPGVQPPVNATPTNTLEPLIPPGDETVAPPQVTEPEPPVTPTPPPPPVDTDSDGLTDIDELQIGSNPRVVDTDLDGLDDYSEVRVYRSDPVSRDTDGDHYDDGTEVKNGFNPTGTGKL